MPVIVQKYGFGHSPNNNRKMDFDVNMDDFAVVNSKPYDTVTVQCCGLVFAL